MIDPHASMPSQIIPDEMRATQQADLKEGLAMILTGVTRLRESHDALLEAAQGAVDLLDRRCGYASDFDERLDALKAAIAKAEGNTP